MNPRTLLAIILAFVALTASSVVATTPSEASHGTDHYVYARITARLAADGHQVEFALQRRLAGNTWGARIFPRARYFPTSTATVDQWLVSSTLTLPALDGPSSETEVRITARLRDNGQVEFALQDRNDDATWASHIFPRARYFPTNATVGQWLVSSTLGATLPRSAVDADRAALEAFYRSTGGQDWTVQTNWLSSRLLGEWYGVQTDINGRVISLDIDSNRLSGSIPPQLGTLTKLRWLSLSSNDLVGSIPPELGNLTALEALVLNFGNLTGSIPPELGSLTHLRFLEINDNSLTGSIPPQLGNLTKLWALRLNDNSLSGSIPPQLGNLADLGRLRLSDNNLSGPIPPAVSAMIAHLVEFTLDGNHFTGTVPPNRVPSGPDADRSVLEALYHSTGGREWYDQTNWLTERPLGEWAGVETDSDGPRHHAGSEREQPGGLHPSRTRQPDGTRATRPRRWQRIPRSHAPVGADSTRTRQPRGATITGSRIDRSVGADSTRTRKPHRTHRSVPLEQQPVGLHPTRTRQPHHARATGYWLNSLSGGIPPELGNLTSLVWLWLHGNNLSGSIPPELSNLENLLFLLLEWNNLSGPIPPELGNFASLGELGLGYNALSGPIPPELGNIATLVALDLRNNNLSGPIPPEVVAMMSRLDSLLLDNNRLTGTLPPPRWEDDIVGPLHRR